ELRCLHGLAGSAVGVDRSQVQQAPRTGGLGRRQTERPHRTGETDKLESEGFQVESLQLFREGAIDIRQQRAQRLQASGAGLGGRLIAEVERSEEHTSE